MKFLIVTMLSMFLLITALLAQNSENSPILAKTQVTALLSESFEGAFPPSGWKLLSSVPATENWRQTDKRAHNGTKSAYCEAQYFYMNNWLVTPAINLTGITKATLSFYESEEDWATNGTHHYIKVSTTSQTNMSSFTTLLDMTPANHTINGFDGAQVQVDLSSYVGNSTVYIAFQIVQESKADIWYVDDVKVFKPQDHDAAAFDITMNSHCTAYSTVQPTGIFKNEGLNTETFDVHFGYYDKTDSKVYVNTKTVTALAAGASAEVTFDDYTFGSNKLKYFIETELSTDMDNSNDEFTKYIDSYAVQQSVVLIEEFTSTTCVYCPGCASALDALHDNYPDGVAIVAYHVDIPSTGDPYVNQIAKDRQSFYSVSSAPTSKFNGTITQVGGAEAGADWSGIYNNYESIYLSEREKFTPMDLDLAYTKNGNVITIAATVTYSSETSSKNDNIYFALCESHIAFNWQTSMDSLHFVERNMYPNVSGVKIYTGATDPPLGHQEVETVEFTIPSGVVEENCEFIAFIQDPATKEVKNSAKIDLGNPVSGIDVTKSINQPASFSLSQNYPNPFNPTTTLSYNLPSSALVEINLFDARGSKIKTLFRGQQEMGTHQLAVDGSDWASGVYFYQLKAAGFIQTRKMILIR